MTDEVKTYTIWINGRVDEADINVGSPQPIAVAIRQPDRTCATVTTDQSGLLGVVRYLHGQGIRLHAIADQVPGFE